jgi:hypothetical protein
MDPFVITIVPTLIGEGIPLISLPHREVPFRLISVNEFPHAIVQRHYNVQQPRPEVKESICNQAFMLKHVSSGRCTRKQCF